MSVFMYNSNKSPSYPAGRVRWYIGTKRLGSQMEREMGKQNKCKQIRRQVKKGK